MSGGRREPVRTAARRGALPAGDPLAGFAHAVLYGCSLRDKLAPPPDAVRRGLVPAGDAPAGGAQDGVAPASHASAAAQGRASLAPAVDAAGKAGLGGSSPEPLQQTWRAVLAPPPSPGRPPSLGIRRGPATRVPPLAGMADPAQRVRIVHAFANHELQAIELFAWALLAFPDAPRDLRAGLLATLADEQRHLRLYLDRLAAWDVSFGDFPVSGYLWGKAALLTTARRFVAVVGLTFEGANLDHSLDYAEAARRAGDHATADVLAAVHEDEVRHVRFAVHWLARLKRPDESLGEAWRASLPAPLRPARARGRTLHRLPRTRAGYDGTLLAALEDKGG